MIPPSFIIESWRFLKETGGNYLEEKNWRSSYRYIYFFMYFFMKHVLRYHWKNSHINHSKNNRSEMFEAILGKILARHLGKKNRLIIVGDFFKKPWKNILRNSWNNSQFNVWRNSWKNLEGNSERALESFREFRDVILAE